MLIPENTADTVFSVRKTRIPTEYRKKRCKMFQELSSSNVSIFFSWLSFKDIPFDEYNNFRHFKVSYKDTRTFFLLLTLIRFHTSFGGSK